MRDPSSVPLTHPGVPCCHFCCSFCSFEQCQQQMEAFEQSFSLFLCQQLPVPDGKGCREQFLTLLSPQGPVQELKQGHFPWSPSSRAAPVSSTGCSAPSVLLLHHPKPLLGDGSASTDPPCPCAVSLLKPLHVPGAAFGRIRLSSSSNPGFCQLSTGMQGSLSPGSAIPCTSSTVCSCQGGWDMDLLITWRSWQHFGPKPTAGDTFGASPWQHPAPAAPLSTPCPDVRHQHFPATIPTFLFKCCRRFLNFFPSFL